MRAATKKLLFEQSLMSGPIQYANAFKLIFCLTCHKICGLCAKKVHMYMVFVSFLADERDKLTEKGVVE